jgi:hypothetical protein
MGPALASAYSNVAVDQMLGGLIKQGAHNANWLTICYQHASNVLTIC